MMPLRVAFFTYALRATVMNPIPGILSFAVQMSRADPGDSSPEQTVTVVGPLTEVAARRTCVVALADLFAG
jgi:hypothetical protein